jgi:hypothetical protein
MVCLGVGSFILLATITVFILSGVKRELSGPPPKLTPDMIHPPIDLTQPLHVSWSDPMHPSGPNNPANQERDKRHIAANS